MSSTEGISIETFKSLMKHIHYKIMACKRIDNRRWISLPVKHKCVLVVNTIEGVILHKVYGIEQADEMCVFFEEELGKDCNLRQVALIVDCYNYSNKFMGRIAMDISGDFKTEQSFIGLSIESESLRVRDYDAGYTFSRGYTIDNGSMDMESFPSFYADGGKILS